MWHFLWERLSPPSGTWPALAQIARRSSFLLGLHRKGTGDLLPLPVGRISVLSTFQIIFWGTSCATRLAKPTNECVRRSYAACRLGERFRRRWGTAAPCCLLPPAAPSRPRPRPRPRPGGASSRRGRPTAPTNRRWGGGRAAGRHGPLPTSLGGNRPRGNGRGRRGEG